MPMPRFALVLLLAATFGQVSQARDNCYGPVVELTLTGDPAGSSKTSALVKYGVLAGFGGNLSDPLTSLRIATAEPIDACGPVDAESAAGAALLVARGNCNFTEKALAAQSAGAAAMLLYDNQPGCVTLGADPNTTADVLLPLISIAHDLGPQLAAMAAVAGGGGSGGGSGGGGYTLSVRLVSVPLVDSGAVLLWLLAVGTLVAGSWWSGADHQAGRRGGADDQDPASGRSQQPAKGPAGGDVLDLTPRAALAFVGVASCMLLLLYFLLNRVFFFVLLALFCLASIQSQTALYSAGLQALMPPGRRNTMVPVPWLGPCPLAVVASLPVAVVVAVVWAVERNEDWAWLLQDLQGVALMLLVLRTLRVPTLKVACILLPACLLYDVFWVFIQPMLFGGGESVMVQVAQGGTSGEFIPMLLRVPHFGYGGLAGYSLLGFGDVILPGLLVAFTRRVDLDLGLDLLRHAPSYLLRSYFPYTVFAYGAGLCLTYAALSLSWFGDQGQPALLYLVPCTLLTVLGLAAARGQVAAMWRGEMLGLGLRLVADHDSDAGEGVGGGGRACSLAPALGDVWGTGSGGGDVEAGLLGGRGWSGGPGLGQRLGLGGEAAGSGHYSTGGGKGGGSAQQQQQYGGSDGERARLLPPPPRGST